MDDILRKTGVVHGRFQILHKDHVKYILAGKAQCDHLVVGITNPDPGLTRDEEVDPGRSSVLSNPLTYYERYLCVKTIMMENKIDPDAFSIIPFPINFPELYKYYVPMAAVFFITIYDGWGKQKEKYFTQQNLNTHVLWEVPIEHKGISSTGIRSLMMEGKPWEHLVPRSIALLMKEWKIPDRLRKINDEANK